MSAKSIILSSQEHDDPMAYIHFTAEGEVTFKSILFVPNSAPRGLFDEYGSKKSDFIKVGQKSVVGVVGMVLWKRKRNVK